LAGEVKDIAAGAVLICAITAAVVGLIVFTPYLF
ncbi:MAG: diacylglycerol kinase, partial [Bacteroides sp.]